MTAAGCMGQLHRIFMRVIKGKGGLLHVGPPNCVLQRVRRQLLGCCSGSQPWCYQTLPAQPYEEFAPDACRVVVRRFRGVRCSGGAGAACRRHQGAVSCPAAPDVAAAPRAAAVPAAAGAVLRAQCASATTALMSPPVNISSGTLSCTFARGFRDCWSGRGYNTAQRPGHRHLPPWYPCRRPLAADEYSDVAAGQRPAAGYRLA